jgi:uncharacterized protein YdhG (YjbR/CyaY superfamily)
VNPDERHEGHDQAHVHDREGIHGRREGGHEGARQGGTLLAKLAEMPAEDRAMGEKIHAIMKANAPTLEPKTWYGMPAYAKDGKVICFFQPASKFGARYSTFGFNDDAKLDDGTMWPTSFALTKLSAADEATITKLVRKAIGD